MYKECCGLVIASLAYYTKTKKKKRSQNAFYLQQFYGHIILMENSVISHQIEYRYGEIPVTVLDLSLSVIFSHQSI